MNPLPQLRIMIPIPTVDVTPSYVRHFARTAIPEEAMNGFLYMYRDLMEDNDFYEYVISHDAMGNHAPMVIPNTTPFMNEYDIKTLFERLYRGHTGYALNALRRQLEERGFVSLVDEWMNCWVYVG